MTSEHSQKPLIMGRSNGPLRFTSIGECMAEMAPAEITGQYKLSFAGDTFNTVWYTKMLRPDWSTSFVSRIGQDPISDDMLNMMVAHGVDVTHVQRSAEKTIGLYLISLKDGERSFAYWRSQSAARHFADNPALVATATDGADVLFFSGITMAILAPAARNALLGILEAARAAGSTIVFDPNLRPKLWSDTDEMRDTIMGAAAISDIILPSFDEEAEHFGDVNQAATVARYQSVGSASVILKNGPGAIYFSYCGQTGQVVPDPVTSIIDTTSAGDSFNSGLITGLAHYGSVEDAVRMAGRVARQVIGQRGALVPLDLGDIF